MEKGGERWSKPHVATLSLHSLMELKTCIEKGTIMLDLEAATLPQVVGECGGEMRDVPFFCCFFFNEQRSPGGADLSNASPDRDDHRQPDRGRAAEGRPEGEGHVHAAAEASPPDQEVQLALSCRHWQECLQCKQTVFQPGEW